MKQALALAAFLLSALPLAAQTDPPAPGAVPRLLDRDLAASIEPPATGGCNQRIEIEPQKPLSVTNCETLFTYSTGWHYDGNCCSNGKQELINEITYYYRCGTGPIQQYTVTYYTCSDSSWCS